MAQILSIALRPRKFGDLIGQESLTKAIVKHYSSGREPQAWMFVGPTGSGKTTIARIIGLSLQCGEQETFGDPCEKCLKRKADFDVVEINASEVSGVEEIGNVVQGSNHLPLPPSRRRVYILDEAHMLSRSSQNLLLKYFEDTPKTTVWIVCTTEPNLILRTLRGRCLVYPLQPLKGKDVETLVERSAKLAGVTLNMEPLLDQLLTQKIGSPRHILQALEKYTAGATPEMAVLEGEAAINTLRICQAVTKGDWNSAKQEMSAADVNDSRVARLALAQYLRTIMVTSDGAKASAASDSIVMLAQIARTEEGVQVAYTLSVFHQIAKRFSK